MAPDGQKIKRYLKGINHYVYFSECVIRIFYKSSKNVVLTMEVDSEEYI